jgi:cyclopropane fatty-acyl-phospholipid synthase-like methyltransferase
MTTHTPARGATILLAAVLFGAGLASAQRTAQQQRTPEEYAKFLEDPGRVSRMQVPRVVATLGLKPGMKVADIGAGSGLFTRPIASAVAPATVYAVDIDPALLTIIDARAADAGLRNIRAILAAADDPRIPEPVDLILICDALHHIANQGPYLKTIRRYLAPGGRVAIIDFQGAWPEGHEKLQYSKDQFEAWMKDGGFTLVESHDWLENSFFVIYR